MQNGVTPVNEYQTATAPTNEVQTEKIPTTIFEDNKNTKTNKEPDTDFINKQYRPEILKESANLRQMAVGVQTILEEESNPTEVRLEDKPQQSEYKDPINEVMDE